jgi:zinc transporter ZupT
MIRVLAVCAAIVAIVLFVVVAIGNPTDPVSVEAWGFVSVAACLLCIALEPLLPRVPR